MFIGSGVISSGYAPLPVYSGMISSGGINFGNMQFVGGHVNREGLVFLAEQKTDPERTMMIKLFDHPEDKLTRYAYADWLEEQGRTQSAKYVRGGFTPRAT